MRIRVLDTSSIIEIKEIPKKVRPRVLVALDRLVEAGVLFFPVQVIGELQRWSDGVVNGNPDVSLEWARKNESKATQHGLLLSEAKAVLAQVPDLIDPTKVSVGGVDEADPYVVALAARLKQEGGGDITVVTEDQSKRPRRTSLANAAGVFLLPSINLRTLLIFEEKILDSENGF